MKFNVQKRSRLFEYEDLGKNPIYRRNVKVYLKTKVVQMLQPRDPDKY